MQQLSQVLENMPQSASEKSPDTSSIQPRGSTAVVGKTSIPDPTTLVSLRELAQTAQRGEMVTDQSLEASLRQHFGSRLVMTHKMKPVYGLTGGYDEKPDGFYVFLAELNDNEQKFYEAIEFFNKPASNQVVAGQIARLRVTMLRSAEENTDIELLVDTLVADCRSYPADILIAVCETWRREQKFFPFPKDFIEKLENAVQFRRSLLKAFTAARNPQLTQSVKPVIAADPRLGIHWKVLPRAQWMRQHYDWWIGEAEKMVDLATQNPNFMDLVGWQAEVARRKAEHVAANRPNSSFEGKVDAT